MKAFVTYSDEKVNHEENVEGQIDLLRRVLFPWHALLHSLTEVKSKR